MVAGRYRIVGLLGKGGMGEVYRADDLKVGHPVALKFLPEELARDAGRLARFVSEVRTARQVTHPNVCRVHDIGEVDGLHYLSMEYVDGENLASLLRRVGRLPEDRAIQVARQICSGLSAAHDRGILHRDLKPANVMLDGRGQARITDFGLAGLADEISSSDPRVGTPAYMSPEQLAGTDLTVRSDLYSLGLVLYELFTGRAAFAAENPAELSGRRGADLTTPSSVVGGLDPAVERAILRCLEPDPRLRPASAMAVAASLPGGDPLAAALAAGETPSPQMVAAAGEEGGLHPWAGAVLVGLIIAGLAVMIALAERANMLERVRLDKPPDALVDRAQQVLRRLGHVQAPRDRAQGFSYVDDYVHHVRDTDASPGRWDSLAAVRPPPIRFWYRQSPRDLVPLRFRGPITPSDPPLTISGMTGVSLDPSGRLVSLISVPPQVDDLPADPAEPAWALLFEEAGLEMARFRPATPRWSPLIDCQQRAAWEGEYAEQPGTPIRVEACAYGGVPYYMSVIAPWTKPSRMQEASAGSGERVGAWISVGMLLLIVAVGLLLVRRNLRLGRGDRRGAFRLALFLFVASLITQGLAVHHVPALSEVLLLIGSLQESLMFPALAWVVYMAIEPFVRRLWPGALISWSRLLAGRFRDPRVGRDILVGGMGGMVACLLRFLCLNASGWFGFPPDPPIVTPVELAGGLNWATIFWLSSIVGSLVFPIGLLLLLLVARVILRRQWAAFAVVLVLMGVWSGLQSLAPETAWSGPRWLQLLVLTAISSILWMPFLWVMIRFGLLAGMFYSYFWNLHVLFPLTSDLSLFYAGRTLFPVLVAAGLAVYGFSIARAGRPLIREELLAT